MKCKMDFCFEVENLLFPVQRTTILFNLDLDYYKKFVFSAIKCKRFYYFSVAFLYLVFRSISVVLHSGLHYHQSAAVFERHVVWIIRHF